MKWQYKDRWRQESLRRESLRTTASCPVTLIVDTGDGTIESVNRVVESFQDSFIKRNMLEIRRWLKRHQTHRLNVDIRATNVDFSYDRDAQKAVATWQLVFIELLPPGPRPLP